MSVASQNFLQQIYDQVVSRPDRVALQEVAKARTYREFWQNVCALSEKLEREFSVGPGDRVCFQLENGIRFVELHFALLKIGAISVPIEFELREVAVSQLLSLVEPKVFFGQQRIDSAAHAEVDLDRLFALGDLSDIDLRGARPSSRPDEDIAYIMATTGSTGSPKLVPLNILGINMAMRNTIGFMEYDGEQHELVTLPLSHNFGLIQTTCNLMTGGTAGLIHGLSNFKAIFEFFDAFSPTGFPGTPTSYNLLLNRFPKKMAGLASKIRYAVINSEPLPAETLARIRATLPNTRICFYYGLTEASRSTFIDLTAVSEDRLSSVGRALAGVELKLFDSSGAEVDKPGEKGEILISGDHVIPHYLPIGSHQDNFRGSWFTTKDIGYLDSEGYLFITGRTSAFINVGGLKIDPAEIEAILSRMDGIVDVAVVGMSTQRGGEEVVAAIQVSDSSADPIDSELKKACRAELGNARVPSRFFRVMEIPRSATGKLKRQEVKDMIKGILG